MMMPWIVSLLATTSSPAIVPRSVGTDPHIQVVAYSPSTGIELRGFLGFQTVIEFEAGERIENVAIGDATAWQVTPSKSAGALFVKPITHAKPTNMTVITDARTYSFALTVAGSKASSASAAWVLRFRFPAQIANQTSAAPAPITASGKNIDYSCVGAEAVLPTQVFDDGVRTYFAWAPQVALPAIYAINPDNTESLVNFTMRDGFAVVQQTAGRFTLRQGESAATVTSTPGVRRRVATKSGSAKHDL